MNLRKLGMTCGDERGSQKFEIPFEEDECASQYGVVGQRARYNLQHIAHVEEYTYYVERVAHAEGVHHERNVRYVTQQRGALLEQPVRQHVGRSEIENRVSQSSCRTPKVAGLDMGIEVCENGTPGGCEMRFEEFPCTSDCNIGAGCLCENGSKVVNETSKLLTAHEPNRDVSLPGVAAQYSLGGCDQFESERSEGAVSYEKWRHLLTPTGNYMEFNNIKLRSNHFLNFNDLVPNMDILDFGYFDSAIYTEDINVEPYIDFDMDFNVFFFPPHLFTAMGLSFFGRFLYWPVSRCALADCFYTGQPPDLQNPEKMVTPGGWGLAVGAGLPPEVGSWWGSCRQRWCVPTSPNPTGKPRRLAWPLG